VAVVFALGSIPGALVACFIAFATPVSDVVPATLPPRGWRAEAGAPLFGAAVIAIIVGVLCYLGIKLRERIAPRALFARAVIVVLIAGAFTMVPDLMQFFLTRGRGGDFATLACLILYPLLAPLVVMTTREPEPVLRD
jgi:hypothetical protein